MQNSFSAEPSPPPARRRWLPVCLAGCLVAFLVAVGLCAGGLWYVVRNVKTIAADVARQTIARAVRQSELDEEEKQAIMVQVDRVVDQYKAGKISNEDLQRVMEELAESPLVGVVMLYSVEAKYIAPSGLDGEERQQAQRTLQRVLRGAYDEAIAPGELESLVDHVSVEAQDGTRQLRDAISDDELRTFLDACRDVADRADVPDEPFEVKISEEFRRAVDRALARP